MNKAQHSISVGVTPAVLDRLTAMSKKAGDKSMTDLFRFAFAVYEELLEVREKGGKIVLQEPGKADRELDLTWTTR